MNMRGGWRPKLARRFVLAALVVIAVSSCAGAPAGTDPASVGYVSIPGSQKLSISQLDGLDLRTGEPVSLPEGAVALNFWASWCGPCRAETPLLADIQKRFAAKCGFQIVGIDQQDSAPNARAFLRSFDVRYPNIGDPDGKVLLQVPSAVRPRFIPSTVFLVPDHTVTGVFFGELRAASVRTALNTALGRDCIT